MKENQDKPQISWKDACMRDMTEAGLNEDNATNRAEWRKNQFSYIGGPKLRDTAGVKKKILKHVPSMIFGAS